MQFIKCPQTTTKMTTIFSGRAAVFSITTSRATAAATAAFSIAFLTHSHTHTQTGERERERGGRLGRHSMPSPQGSYTAVEERAEGRVRADGRARAVDRKTNFDGRRDDGERERECRLRCGGDGVGKERRPSGERERPSRDRPRRLLSEALALARRGVATTLPLAGPAMEEGRSTRSLEYASPDSTPIRHKLGLVCLIPWEPRSLTTRSVKGISNFHTQPTCFGPVCARVRLAACVRV